MLLDPLILPILPILPVLPVLLFPMLAPLARAADVPTLTLPDSLTTCQAVNLTWTGGNPVYTLSVAGPAQQPDAPPAPVWHDLTNHSVPWTVNFCGGTDLSVTLVDGGGFQSAVSFVVKGGSDVSCLSPQQLDTPGCAPAPATATDTTSAATAPTATASGSVASGSSGGIPAAVGLSVGLTGLVAVGVSLYMRRRRRRAAGVREPGSESSFVSPEGDGDRHLGSPPPYSNANANANDGHPAGYAAPSSSSLSLSVSTTNLVRPVDPESVQMAQLPNSRIQSEVFLTPFDLTYANSIASSGEEPSPTLTEMSTVELLGGLGAAGAASSTAGPEARPVEKSPAPPPYTVTA